MLSLHLVGERQAWDPNPGVFFLLCCTVGPAGSSFFPQLFSVYPLVLGTSLYYFQAFLFWSPSFPTISTDHWTFVIFLKYTPKEETCLQFCFFLISYRVMGLSFSSTDSSSLTVPHHVAVGLNQGFSASATDIRGQAVLCGSRPCTLKGLSVASPLQHLPSCDTKDVFVCVCVQPCLAPCDPMDCNAPGSSIHGVSQAWILQWVANFYSKKDVFRQCQNFYLLQNCPQLRMYGLK